MPGTATADDHRWDEEDDMQRMLYTFVTKLKDITFHEPLPWYLVHLMARDDVQMAEEAKIDIMLWMNELVELDEMIKTIYGDNYWQGLPDDDEE